MAPILVLLLVLLVSCAPAPLTGQPTTFGAGNQKPIQIPRVAPLTPGEAVSVALDPTVLGNLPLFYAVEHGYFQSAGLDVDVRRYASDSGLRELLRSGAVGIASLMPTPPFYNEFAEDPGLKVISMLDASRSGRAQSAWLTVPKAKAAQVRDLRDLRGRVVDAGPEGAITNLLALEAIRQAELRIGPDVSLQHRAITEADVRSLISEGVDVIALQEPLATRLDQQGVVVRWKSLDTVMPLHQGALVITSALEKQHPGLVPKFVEVYQATARAIDQTGGTWAADLTATAAKWTDVDIDLVRAQGGVPFYGSVLPSKTGFVRTQDIWSGHGLVTKRIDVEKVFSQVNLPLAASPQVTTSPGARATPSTPFGPVMAAIYAAHMEWLVFLVALLLGLLLAAATRLIPRDSAALITSGGFSAILSATVEPQLTEPTGVRRVLSTGGMSLLVNEPSETSGGRSAQHGTPN